MISVIIPVWRDLTTAARTIAEVRRMEGVREVIVALAEPQDGALEIVRELGARYVATELPNRGGQMDCGAAVATGEWLLFHHADTELTPDHVRSLASIGDDRSIVGGAFYRRFDERHPALRRFEAVERWHNRTFGALYGDQSIFARREVFARLGGFRGYPLMEDVDFSLRLRRAGRIVLLDPPISSSPRRHLARGPWRTTCQNAVLLALYRLGVSPLRLHRWYYPQADASKRASGTHEPISIRGPEAVDPATAVIPSSFP